jgi:hypothetical protein
MMAPMLDEMNPDQGRSLGRGCHGHRHWRHVAERRGNIGLVLDLG